MKKFLACLLAAVLVVTSMMPTMKAEAATKEGISAVAYLDYVSFIDDADFGKSLGYSTTWYSSLGDEELLARLIYANVECWEDDAICFVSMLWYRMTATSGTFANVNTLKAVATQAGQMGCIIGTANETLKARQPDRSSDRWDMAVNMACVLCAIVSESGTPAIMWPGSAMPSGYIGQLYWTDYNEFGSYAYDSGGVSYLRETAISDIMIPTLGRQSNVAIAKIMYTAEDDESGGSMLDDPANIYFNKTN